VVLLACAVVVKAVFVAADDGDVVVEVLSVVEEREGVDVEDVVVLTTLLVVEDADEDAAEVAVELVFETPLFDEELLLIELA